MAGRKELWLGVFTSASIAAVIWLVSLLATGLAGLLGDALSLIEAVCPWPKFRAWFVFLVVFFGMHLLSLPFLLNHTRLDAKTGEAKERFAERIYWSGWLDTDWIYWPPFDEKGCLSATVVACVESVVLLLICRALAKAPLAWTEGSVSLLLCPDHSYGYFWGWLGGLVWSLLFLLFDAILTWLVVGFATGWLCQLLSGTSIYAKSFGLGRPYDSQDERMGEFWGGLAIADLCVFAPVFTLILVLYRSLPFLPTMFACFLLMKAFFAGVANFISFWLDWANERRASRAAT